MSAHVKFVTVAYPAGHGEHVYDPTVLIHGLLGPHSFSESSAHSFMSLQA